MGLMYSFVQVIDWRMMVTNQGYLIDSIRCITFGQWQICNSHKDAIAVSLAGQVLDLLLKLTTNSSASVYSTGIYT